MKSPAACVSLILCAIAGSALIHPSVIHPPVSARAHDAQSAFENTEAAYRANNIGVALLEQYKAKDAVDSFNRALEIKPDLLIARINLSIALYYLPDAGAAKREAQKALRQDPNSPQAYYILGLIARAQNQFDDAVADFQRVLKIDPDDVGSNINLGQIFSQQKKYVDAIAAFRRGLDAEPYNETALYNLGILLTRTGEKVEAQRTLKKFQELKESGAGTTIGTNYLEGGHYAEAVVSTGIEPELVDKLTPEVVFTDVTEAALPPFRNLKIPNSHILGQSGGDAALFDFDGDGDLDLVEVAGGSQRLFRNDGGKFTDVTQQSRDLAKEVDGVAMAVVAGDVDNDGRPDLFVLRYGKSALYHNDGSGSFSDVTAAAKIPTYKFLSTSVAFFDYDHDGDLDIVIGGGVDISDSLNSEKLLTDRSPNVFFTIGSMTPPAAGLLLRNNGNGTFTDQTEASHLAMASGLARVIPTDFDNRRDVDLLSTSGNKIALWRNLRDGTFKDVAANAGLTARELTSASSTAVGDLNKDGYPDFYFGAGASAGYFAMSDGRAHFQMKRGPAELNTEPDSDTAQYVTASLLVDYDNDGLLDLVIAVTAPDEGLVMKLRVWRNTGDGWSEVSGKVAPKMKTRVPAVIEGPGRKLLIAGDIDGDGDTDLIFGTIAGGLRIARNDGGNRNHSVKIDLHGRVSNKSAVETKIEMRAGSLYQKLETYSASPAPAPADLIFGLGKREKPDAVRVLWPAGIVQAETEFVAHKEIANFISLNITELDRKPSSCPYLYTWNGERFEFVTDFMGGGEMGYLEEPGRYNQPDPDEYVRIPERQLKEKDGRYELRVTNELEESMFVDRLQLIAVAHPGGTEVYPNEGMSAPPKPFKLFVTRNARPPLSAIDDHGNDVLDLISKMDRRWPGDFKLDQIRGYASEHTLTMKLGEASKVQSPGSKVVKTNSVERHGGFKSATDRRQTLDIGRWTLDQSSDQSKERILLLLTGWTDYAWSSDNVAAAQAKKEMKPPSLQVKDAQGIWRTVIEDIGIPVGRPQTVTVDLSGKFLSANREVRIVTNMRVYWDQILVDTSDGKAPVQINRLDPARADLRWRGFSAEVTPDGREPFGYDYRRVSFTSPWKVMTGRYTREGNVRELLLKSDDMFVVSRPGDEISLSFDASLPPLPVGWTRTFLLYADGFSKEMDINSASPDQLSPMPFHGMSRYPYPATERYPLTVERRRYLEKYNTRIVTAQVPSSVGLMVR